MTNKINGIDVSECEYLNKVVNEEPYCNIDQEHLYTCSSDENCYFKQLKRLQKENEKLKEVTNEAKIEYENLLINRNDFAERAEKYRQALEEIRENIAKLIAKKGYAETEEDFILDKTIEVLNDN